MVTRINGFSSGMDIDSTVKQLMQARRVPLDKLLQKKQTLEWQQDGYREMNTKILDLKNNAFNMKLQSAYLTKKASSADDTAVSATGTANATDGIYKISVSQLAEAASVTSTGAVTKVADGSAITVANKIEDVDAAVVDFKLFIGGEKGTSEIEVKKTDTLAAFISSFNSKSGQTGVKVSFDDTMKRFFFVSTSTGAAAKVELNSTNDRFLDNVLKVNKTGPSTGETVTGSAGFMTTPPDAPDLNKLVDATLLAPQTLRISYNETNYDFTVSNTTKIGDLLNSIKNNAAFKATGIKAGLDSTTGALTFTNPDSNKTITFSDNTGDIIDIVSRLGLPAAPTDGPSITGTTYLSPVPPYADSNIVINSGLTADQTFRINYDGKDYDFTITNTTTIGSLINSINSSDLGKLKSVNARLDSTTGKLLLTTPDNTKHFNFSDATVDGENILNSLGLTGGLNNTAGAGDFTYYQTEDTGQNVKIKYNTVDAEYASNTFTINGVNFTAKKITGDVNITVFQDVDTVYNSIKTFVDKYNEVLGAVNAKISEERYRDYAPLTDEQKSSMKENDITLWEKKAMSGLLRNDSTLSGAVSEFRSDWYLSVSGLASGDYQQLSDIGITTLDYSEKGKLYINEAKLKEAITNDAEAVMRLFTSDDGNSSSTSGDGVAVRIYNATNSILSKLKDKAGNSYSVLSSYEIGKQMSRVDKDITTWQKRLTDIEDQYYRQFTAMEQAMNKYNSQSSYLSQLSGR